MTVQEVVSAICSGFEFSSEKQKRRTIDAARRAENPEEYLNYLSAKLPLKAPDIVSHDELAERYLKFKSRFGQPDPCFSEQVANAFQAVKSDQLLRVDADQLFAMLNNSWCHWGPEDCEEQRENAKAALAVVVEQNRRKKLGTIVSSRCVHGADK
jgi:hypothetical protein